jgi:hypothetical protein
VADDFPAIRARMEELRRERAQPLINEEDGATILSGSADSPSPPANKRLLAPYMRRLKPGAEPRLVGAGRDRTSCLRRVATALYR